MKYRLRKILFCLLILISLIITGVKADSIFNLENFKLLKNSAGAKISNIKINNDTISSNSIFKHTGDNASYEITIKNNTNSSYYIKNISSETKLDNIKYSFDYKKEKILPNKTYKFILNEEYVKNISEKKLKYENQTKIIVETDKQKISFNLINPKTTDNISLYIIISIISITLLGLILTKNKKYNKLFFLLLLTLIPMVSYAYSKSTYIFNENMVLYNDNYKKLIKPDLDYNKDWTNQDVDIKISTPEDTDLDHYEYSTDGGKTWEKVDDDVVTREDEGVNDTLVRAVDEDGETSDSAVATTKIDKTKPVISHEETKETTVNHNGIINIKITDMTIDDYDLDVDDFTTTPNIEIVKVTKKDDGTFDLEVDGKEVSEAIISLKEGAVVDKAGNTNDKYDIPVNIKGDTYTATFKNGEGVNKITPEKETCTTTGSNTSCTVDLPNISLDIGYTNPKVYDEDGNITLTISKDTILTIKAEKEVYNLDIYTDGEKTKEVKGNYKDEITIDVPEKNYIVKLNPNNGEKIDDIKSKRENTGIISDKQGKLDSNKYVFTNSSDVVNVNYSDKGKEIDLPIPKKDGYTFNGWYDNNTKVDNNYVPTKDISLSAKWDVISYTITYNLKNGETTTNPTTYTIETPTFKLSDAIKTGYTFTGWTGSNGDTPSKDVEITKGSTGNKTFTPNFTRDEYTITYNLNGGKVEKENPTKYNVDTETFKLNNPTKVGYTFTGWTGSNGSTPNINISITKGSVGNRNYVANYLANTNTKYIVKHLLMDLDGKNYTLKDTDNLEGVSDSKVTPAVKTYTGFTSPKPTEITIKADGSTVLEYKYTRNKYKFTLGENEGVDTTGSTPTGDYYYGSTINLKGNTKDGYTWSKWSNNDNKENTSFILGANDITVSPIATLNQYTITYNLNGGTVSGNPTTYNVKTPTFKLNNPTKVGYTFTGWTGSNGDTLSKDVSITKGSIGNKTYTANYEANTYNISLNSNGATTKGTETIYEKYNTNIYLDSNNTKAMTNNSNSIVIPNKKYTVSFDGNGGTKPNDITVSHKFNGYYDGSVQMINENGYKTDYLTNTKYTSNKTLTANWTNNSIILPSVTKEGYLFAGWYDSKDGGNKVGDANSSYVPTSNIILYARWSRQKYTITYNLNGGTATNPTEYDVDTETFSLNNPTKVGYTFTGWTGSNGNTPNETVTISKGSSGNKTYTANYEVNSYKINYNLKNGVKGTSAPASANYDQNINISNPTKTITITINANNQDATVSSQSVSQAQTFAGWTFDGNTSTAKYGTNLNSITSAWNDKNAKVTASYFKNLTDKNDATVTMTAHWNSTNIVLPTVTKEGNDCTYNSSSNGSGTSYNSGSNYNADENQGNKELYVICNPKQYTITRQYRLENADGTFGEYQQIDSKKYNYGSTISAWNRAADETYQAATIVSYKVQAKNDILSVNVMRKTSTNNKIQYRLQNADGSYPSTYTEAWSGTLRVGESHTWNRAATTTHLSAAGTVSYNKGTVSVDVKRKSGRFIIKANGGSQDRTTSILYYGQTNTNINPMPTRDGYTLNGLYTLGAGGTKVVNANGTPANDGTYSSNNQWLLTRDVTVYAQWTEKNYTITYDLNGGALNARVTNPTTYTINTETFSLNNPTKTGYVFKGWTGSNGSTPNTNVSITKGTTGDKNYKANFADEDKPNVKITTNATQEKITTAVLNLTASDDGSGLDKYYFGSKSNPSDDEFDSVTTKELNTTVNQSDGGTYYLIAIDKAGNKNSTSIKLVNYNVVNLYEKTDSAIKNDKLTSYSSDNFEGTGVGYIIVANTSINPNNLLTLPDGAYSNLYQGYSLTDTPTSVSTQPTRYSITDTCEFYLWTRRANYELMRSTNDRLGYVQLRLAFANAQNGNSITTLNSRVENDDINYKVDKGTSDSKITWDMNGKTTTLNYDLDVSGVLSIQNSKGNSSLTNNMDNTDPTITIENGGMVLLDGITLQKKSTKDAISVVKVNTGGTLNLSASSISQNKNNLVLFGNGSYNSVIYNAGNVISSTSSKIAELHTYPYNGSSINYGNGYGIRNECGKIDLDSIKIDTKASGIINFTDNCSEKVNITTKSNTTISSVDENAINMYAGNAELNINGGDFTNKNDNAIINVGNNNSLNMTEGKIYSTASHVGEGINIGETSSFNILCSELNDDKCSITTNGNGIVSSSSGRDNYIENLTIHSGTDGIGYAEPGNSYAGLLQNASSKGNSYVIVNNSKITGPIGIKYEAAGGNLKILGEKTVISNNAIGSKGALFSDCDSLVYIYGGKVTSKNSYASRPAITTAGSLVLAGVGPVDTVTKYGEVNQKVTIEGYSVAINLLKANTSSKRYVEIGNKGNTYIDTYPNIIGNSVAENQGSITGDGYRTVIRFNQGKIVSYKGNGNAAKSKFYGIDPKLADGENYELQIHDNDGRYKLVDNEATVTDADKIQSLTTILQLNQ